MMFYPKHAYAFKEDWTSTVTLCTHRAPRAHTSQFWTGKRFKYRTNERKILKSNLPIQQSTLIKKKIAMPTYNTGHDMYNMT